MEIETQPDTRPPRSRRREYAAPIACVIGLFLFAVGLWWRFPPTRFPPTPASCVSSACAASYFDSPQIDMGNVSSPCRLEAVLDHVPDPDHFIPDFWIMSTFDAKCEAKRNTERLNYALEHLRSIDPKVLKTLLVPPGYYVMAGGINANLLHNLVWDMTGAAFDFAACVTARSASCKIDKKTYGELASFSDGVVEDIAGNRFSKNLKPAISVCGVTSFEWFGAQLRGGGGQWYGLADIAVYGDNRGTTKPILVDGAARCAAWGEGPYGASQQVEIRNFELYYPPYWSTYFHMEHSSIHDGRILAERRPLPLAASSPPERFLQLFINNVLDFNTDGIDIMGQYNHVYNMDIRVGDDIVAMKGGTDMLFENITGEGAGLSIGTESLGSQNGRNITFRNCVLPNTLRAIYVKADAEDVVYENIEVGTATLFPIWVGPAYQELTQSNPCGLAWPFLPALFLSLAQQVPASPVGVAALTCSGGRSNTRVTIRNMRMKNTYSTPVVILGTKNKVPRVIMENVELPDAVLQDSPFAQVYPRSFLVSPNATCRDANATFTDVVPASAVQSCEEGGFPSELSAGEVGNGVSLCSKGSFGVSLDDVGPRDFFGVCGE